MRSAMRTFLIGALAVAVCGGLLYAQHPSGHASGSAGFHTSGATGFHSSSFGTRSGNTGVRFGNSGFSGINSLPPPASGISPFAWRQIQRSNRYAYRNTPYGYFFAPYYYPFLGYSDSGYSGGNYDGPPPGDQGVQSMARAEGALGRQVQKLSDQIQELRAAQERGAIPEDSDAQQTLPQVPITVVLRNGQHMQVLNYAVMDQTFWDFSRQPARKIPISNIDISASTRATEASGGEFPSLRSTP